MTHKPKVAEVVEHDFDSLPGDHRNPLSHENQSSNPQKHNGYDPWKEIMEAISEKEIMSLRESLQKIAVEKDQHPSGSADSFHLTEKQDFSALFDEQSPCFPEVDDLPDPLPRIHLHHHKRIQGETIHQFYKEQLKTEEEVSDELFSTEFEEEWSSVEEAVQEKDIMELRHKLQFIGKNVSTHPFSADEIGAYLEGSMLPGDLQYFEDELALNPDLQADIELNLELEEAVGEEDVMELRDMMGDILRRQNSTTRDVVEIDAFLEGELNGEDYEEFVREMYENKGLSDEVKLIREVNAALSESEIMELRNELQQISRDIYRQESKSVLQVTPGLKGLTKIGTVAAAMVLVFGFSLLFRTHAPSSLEIYDRFYDSPRALSAFRSASKADDLLNQGIQFYNKGDYASALNCFGSIGKEGENNPAAQFFSGASYQNLQQFSNAVTEYDKVILHKHNLFVEQAEWYRALSLIGSGKFDKASTQLNLIVASKGFYARNAGELQATLKRRKK